MHIFIAQQSWKLTCASEPQLAALRTTQKASERTSDSVSGDVASYPTEPDSRHPQTEKATTFRNPRETG